jgi:hypothetical protein
MTTEVKDVVREKYGQAALRARAGTGNSCCGGAGATDCGDPITSNLYDSTQEGELPELALKASLGCGNPTAQGLDADALAKEVDGQFIGGFVRAVKPQDASCCGPSCCN